MAITSQPHMIFSAMEENPKLIYWKVRSIENPPNYPVIGMSEEEISIQESIEKLKRTLEGISGNGLVEVMLNEKPFSKEKNGEGPGGNVTSKLKFKIEINNTGKATAPVSGIEKFSEKEINSLRSKIDDLTAKLKAYEVEEEVRKRMEPIEKKLAALEAAMNEDDDDDEFSGIGKILTHPLVVPILEKLSGQKMPLQGPQPAQPQSPVLNGLPDPETDEEAEATADDLIDESIDTLCELYGVVDVAEFLATIAEAAEKNPEKVKNLLPMVKSIL